MANFDAKSPLVMECPHCGKRGAHRVVATKPGNYHWGKDSVELFKRIAGRDLSYRSRTKRCQTCGRDFTSVEMAFHYLEAMMEEIARLEGIIIEAEVALQKRVPQSLG